MPILTVRGRRWPSSVYGKLAIASLLLAGVSEAFPSAPAYDPWAWIIWGREILHLQLVTSGGPTWKPLPVIFTTLFAPVGRASPDLWLLVARAGGILALALAGLLAGRLTIHMTGDRTAAAAAAILAGVGLALVAGYPEGVALGESEGILCAFVLLAFLRHLDGAPRQAFALWFAAGLVRSEVWPFFGLYAIYLWRRDPGARKLIALLLPLTAALWFLPELWGSGSLGRGVQWAKNVRSSSPALTACPFCSELRDHAWPLTIAPWKIGLVILGAIAVAPRANRWSGRAMALAAIGLAWIVEEAVFTQMGFSGSDRYLIAPVALLVVAGAVGWGSLMAQTSRLRGARLRVAALAAASALLVVSVPWQGTHMARLAQAASESRLQATLWRDVEQAVTEAGGARRLTSCGAIQTNPSEAPLAAWALGVQLRGTETGRGNVLIQSGDSQSAAEEPRPREGTHYRLLAQVHAVRILASCVPERRVRAASGAPGDATS